VALKKKMAHHEGRSGEDYCKHLVLKQAKYEKETLEMFAPLKEVGKAAKQFGEAVVNVFDDKEKK
jgi:hypothetical protein